MDLDVAHGAVLTGLEIFHNTTLADCRGKKEALWEWGSWSG